MGFKFFTFLHTCFNSKRKGGNWSAWLSVERRQMTAWRWRRTSTTFRCCGPSARTEEPKEWMNVTMTWAEGGRRSRVGAFGGGGGDHDGGGAANVGDVPVSWAIGQNRGAKGMDEGDGDSGRRPRVDVFGVRRRRPRWGWWRVDWPPFLGCLG